MHIEFIEGVQIWATKLVPGTKNMDYDQRLAYLNNLPKFEERRVRGDMIETYKILTGKEERMWNRLFQMAPERGDWIDSRFKVVPKETKVRQEKICILSRDTQKWNDLSKEEVQARETLGFKEKYDKNWF